MQLPICTRLFQISRSAPICKQTPLQAIPREKPTPLPLGPDAACMWSARELLATPSPLPFSYSPHKRGLTVQARVVFLTEVHTQPLFSQASQDSPLISFPYDADPFPRRLYLDNVKIPPPPPAGEETN